MARIDEKYVHNNVDKMADKTKSRVEKGAKQAESLIDKGRERMHSAADRAKEGYHKAETRVRKKPMRAVIGSFIVGSIAGMITALVAKLIWRHKKGHAV